MKAHASSAPARTLRWLALGLCVSTVAWLYARRADEGINPRGDLFSPWLGTRELLLHGRNPYSQEVSHEIQMAFYGHIVEQKYDQPGVALINEQRFAYPVYVVFLLAPTVSMDFPQLLLWALIVLALLTAISVFLWLNALNWRPPAAVIAAIVLVVLASPQIVQGLRLRQLGMLVGFLLTLAAWCIRRNHLAVAGVLLAFSTVKPQMVLLPLIWFLFWGLSGCRRRWPLLAGFGITLVALVGAGEILLPGWPLYFLNGLTAYPKYFPVGSLSILRLALGSWAGGAVSLIAIAGLGTLAWRNRHLEAESEKFIRTLAAFLIGATLVLPILTPFNQTLLLLPALMILRDWYRIPLFGRILFTVVVAWPWIVALGLMLVHTPLDSTHRIAKLPSALVLFVPFLFVVLHLAAPQSISKPVPPSDIAPS